MDEFKWIKVDEDTDIPRGKHLVHLCNDDVDVMMYSGGDKCSWSRKGDPVLYDTHYVAYYAVIPPVPKNVLAKCPFCKGRDVRVVSYGTADINTGAMYDDAEYMAVCSDCGATGPTGDTELMAVNKWNKWGEFIFD